jgi:hypothetical protein
MAAITDTSSTAGRSFERRQHHSPAGATPRPPCSVNSRHFFAGDRAARTVICAERTVRTARETRISPDFRRNAWQPLLLQQPGMSSGQAALRPSAAS